MVLRELFLAWDGLLGRKGRCDGGMIGQPGGLVGPWRRQGRCKDGLHHLNAARCVLLLLDPYVESVPQAWMP
jgi:hypothetical protein